jgi:hypothetical protein
MSNVLKFPKKKFQGPPVERLKRIDLAALKAAAPSRASLRCALAVAWMLVRVPLFLVMYWLRLPVMLVCNFVSIPALSAFLFSLYAFPEKTNMVWGFGVVSFGAFVVLWIYDFVLMLLSPQDLVKSL